MSAAGSNTVVKYTSHFLNKLEDIFAESEYNLRYEKGHFKSGYCVLKADKLVIINKYYSLDGKINSLVEILRNLEIDHSKLSEKNRSTLLELTQTSLNL